MKKTSPEVRLVWRTPNPKRVIATAARMTYSVQDVETLMDAMTDEQIDRSVNAILERRHYSCLRHVSFCFTIAGVSRAFSHQLVRHNIGHSFEQRSQHYRVEKDPAFITPKTIEGGGRIQDTYEAALNGAQASYEALIEYGVPKEDARFVLPNATETQLIWTANLEAFMNFIKTRACRMNTSEITQVAIQVRHLILNSIPEMAPYLGPTCWTQGICFEGEKFYRECNQPWQSPTVLWTPMFPKVIELVKIGGTAGFLQGNIIGGPHENH